MTTAERIRAASEARGRAEERADTLIEQMTDRFGRLPDEVVQRIRSADLDQLRLWTKRVLTARTIDETLA